MVTIVTLHQASKAQCDTEVLYTSNKQEFTNGKDEIQKTEEEKVTVDVSKTNLILTHNDDPNDVMQGTIKSVNCNWTEPYKTGKTTIEAELTEGHNDVHQAVVTIEGKDGQIVISIELADHPDMKIKAHVDKYEQKS